MSGGVPAGWVLVPVEPTQEMLNAAVDATEAGAGMSWNGRSPQKLFQQAYAAMLAATPTPPIEGRDADVERVARAICKARGWNPDTCIFGSSASSSDGEATSTCHAWMWQNCIPEARAALQALGERE